MLDEKQQSSEVNGLTGADVVIALQIIARLVSTGNIQDVELQAVGTARNNLVKALEATTGVNFDQARAAQQRAIREAQEQARAAQAAQAANQEDAPAAPAPVTAAPVSAAPVEVEAPEAVATVGE